MWQNTTGWWWPPRASDSLLAPVGDVHSPVAPVFAHPRAGQGMQPSVGAGLEMATGIMLIKSHHHHTRPLPNVAYQDQTLTTLNEEHVH